MHRRNALILASSLVLSVFSLGFTHPVDAATVAEAEKLTKSGRYPEAFAILNEAIANDDRDARAHELRQECSIKLWKPDIALTDLIFLRKRDPRNPKWPGQMAEAFQLIEQNDRLVGCLKEASQLAPDSIYEERLAAWRFQVKKDYANASKAWAKCIARHPQDAFARLSRATLYENMGKRAEAIKDLNVVKRDRQDLRPYALLSMWCAYNAQIPEALKVAEEMEKINRTAGLTARASIYTYTDNLHDAILTWEKVIAAEPKEPNWRINKARLCLKSGNTKTALEDLHYALNLSLRNKEKKAEVLKQLALLHQEMREYKKAIAFFNEAITTHSANGYMLIVARAQCNMAAHQKEAAIDDLKKAMKLKPERSEAMIALGQIYANDYRWDLAEPYFLKGIQIGFTDRDLFEKLFELYLKKPDEKKALIVLNKWKTSVPDDPNAYLCAARLAHDRGRFDEALSEYNQAYAHHAIPWKVLSSRQKLLRKLGRIDEAIADLNKLVLLEPSSRPIDWYVARADCYLKKGNTKQALADYDKALSFGQKYSACYGRAALYERLGKYPQALVDVDNAIKLNPKESEALRLRAKILTGKGDYAEARREYTALILKIPTMPALYKERAVVFEKLGDKEKAQKDLKMAAELERK